MVTTAGDGSWRAVKRVRAVPVPSATEEVTLPATTPEQSAMWRSEPNDPLLHHALSLRERCRITRGGSAVVSDDADFHRKFVSVFNWRAQNLADSAQKHVGGKRLS